MAVKFLIRDLMQLIRLLPVKEKEPYLLFRHILGFFPSHIELYQLALRHKSASVKNEKGFQLNNERLEFLGDAVLNVLVSDILFHIFDNQQEGFLSKARSQIVSRESLNRIALELGIDQLLRSVPSPITPHHYLYGNALEALIGAIYIDQGYRRCKQFLKQKIFDHFIDIQRVATTDPNYKSRLLEWAQRHKKTVTFQTEEQTVPEEKIPYYHALALINDHLLGEGSGYSKKEAQQQAARTALTKLHEWKASEITESPF